MCDHGQIHRRVCTRVSAEKGWKTLAATCRQQRVHAYAPADVTSAQDEAVPASLAPGAAALAQTEQNMHQTMLAPHKQDSARDASTVPVAGGRTKDYCDWWREQVLEQNDLSLFNVRLVGDASSPQLFTSMAHIDLAYCRYACFWKDLVRRLLSYNTCLISLQNIRLEHLVSAASGVTTGSWNIRQQRDP